MLQQGLWLYERAGVQTLYLRLHARKPPLDDIRVRRALQHAVDVDQLFATVYGGRARRASGPYPPEVFGYDQAAPLPAYDPALARSLLREAGLAAGASLVLEAPRGRYPGDDQVPQILAGYFGEVGLRVELRVIEWAAYLQRLQAGQGEHLFLLAGTNRTFDPHFTIARLYASGSAFGKHYYGSERMTACSIRQRLAVTLNAGGRSTPRYWPSSVLMSRPSGWASSTTSTPLDPACWRPRADSLLLFKDGA